MNRLHAACFLFTIFLGAAIAACQPDNTYINTNTTLSAETCYVNDSGAAGVLIINASNIVLDCAGYTTIGNDAGSGIAFSTTTPNTANVTIRNCNIVNYTTGIYDSGTSRTGNIFEYNSITGASAEAGTAKGIALGTQNSTVQYNNVSSTYMAIFVSSTNVKNVTIRYNRVNASRYGIYSFVSWPKIDVYNNTVYLNGYGIYLSSLNGSTVSNNTVYSNTYDGFHLQYSENTTAEGNNITNNTFVFFGQNAAQHNITITNTNTVDGLPVYYNFSASNYVFPSDGGYYGCALCSNVTIANANINSNAGYYIYLWQTSNSILENISIPNSNVGSAIYGIMLATSSGNRMANINMNLNVPGAYSFSFSSSANNTVDGCVLNGTYGALIAFTQSSDNNMSNCNITGRITASNSSGNIFTNMRLYAIPMYSYHYPYDSSQGSQNVFYNLTLATATLSLESFNGWLMNWSIPAAPEGLEDIGQWYNFTNRSSNSWIFVNFSYSDGGIGDVNESSLLLYRYNGTDWLPIAGSGVDTNANIVYGNVTAFSTVAPLGTPLPPPALPGVADSIVLEAPEIDATVVAILLLAALAVIIIRIRK
jgi:parallel beta-helix repeat protein